MRALGYLLASSPSPCEQDTVQSTSGSPDLDSSDAQTELSAKGQAPGWFRTAALQLQDALRTGNGKVSWNACYAVGSLLRSQRAAALAHGCGSLLPLLQELLAALRRCKNHKVGACMHGAEARHATFIITFLLLCCACADANACGSRVDGPQQPKCGQGLYGCSAVYSACCARCGQHPWVSGAVECEPAVSHSIREAWLELT